MCHFCCFICWNKFQTDIFPSYEPFCGKPKGFSTISTLVCLGSVSFFFPPTSCKTAVSYVESWNLEYMLPRVGARGTFRRFSNFDPVADLWIQIGRISALKYWAKFCITCKTWRPRPISLKIGTVVVHSNI